MVGHEFAGVLVLTAIGVTVLLGSAGSFALGTRGPILNSDQSVESLGLENAANIAAPGAPACHRTPTTMWTLLVWCYRRQMVQHEVDRVERRSGAFLDAVIEQRPGFAGERGCINGAGTTSSLGSAYRAWSRPHARAQH